MMGTGYLEITGDLIVGMMKSREDAPKFAIDVAAFPLPDDAKLVRVVPSPDWPDTVNFLIESVSFVDDQRIQSPQLRETRFIVDPAYWAVKMAVMSLSAEEKAKLLKEVWKSD